MKMTPGEIMEEMKRIEKTKPLASEFSEDLYEDGARIEGWPHEFFEDARYTWPDRWDMLKMFVGSFCKFQNTFCSQCGAEFGPGEHGFSHCESHNKDT